MPQSLLLPVLAGVAAGLLVALIFILLYTRSQRRAATGVLAVARAAAERVHADAVREAESARSEVLVAARIESLKLREDIDREIARRRARYFEPYHALVRGEVDRLRGIHPSVVLFDAHSIRSRISRLFDGELPQFNIGTNSGKSCAVELTDAVEEACTAPNYTRVVNGRFKGGWTTRHYGEPAKGIHAIQLELACRGYVDEPETPTPSNWPTPYTDARAENLRGILRRVLSACITFTGAK